MSENISTSRHPGDGCRWAQFPNHQPEFIMLKKFSIDYIAMPKHNTRVYTHLTDDPVEAEEFLMHLLSASARIKEIRHDGHILTGSQFDKMVKLAAERVASRMLAESLAVDGAEIKRRFGF